MPMTIEKAIETNTDFNRGRRASVEPDVHTAIQLGIEALKGYQEGRTLPGGQFFHDLPGETAGVEDGS